jgi:hypothetical protein
MPTFRDPRELMAEVRAERAIQRRDKLNLVAAADLEMCGVDWL